MFFQYKSRIKTQPKVLGQFDGDFPQNKNRLKIKNIRFSLDQESNKMSLKTSILNENSDGLIEMQKETLQKNKKLNYFNKLPELHFEKELIKELEKETLRPKYPKHVKKDTFLSSIIDKLKSNQKQTQSRPETTIIQPPKMWKDWKMQANSRQFINQFCEESIKVNNLKSAKYYRAPKILENQMNKFRNNNNIIRRKIFSQDKDREKVDKEIFEGIKNDGDLDKIEIITFSNKFPGLKKE